MAVAALAVMVAATILAFSNCLSKSGFFKEISTLEEKTLTDAGTAALFSETFHICLARKNCRFITKNIKTNEEFFYASEEKIPKNRRLLRIWKKIGNAAISKKRLTNIALKKSSLLSSIFSSQSGDIFLPSYANDGDDVCGSKKIAISNKEVNPFWIVYLGARSEVVKVAVKTMTTGGKERINPFDIRVGEIFLNGGRNNSFCARDATISVYHLFSNFTCPKIEGRFVSIHLNRDEQLQLCEVQVYGYYLEQPFLDNLGQFMDPALTDGATLGGSMTDSG